MDNWNLPYVVFRISGEERVREVFATTDFQKAKYWMTYIAESGDVLCKTTKHPKHSKKGESPEYWGHKEQSGQMISNEKDWIEHFAKNPNFTFPGQPTRPLEEVQ
jgi:hypothetical protein